MTYIMVMYEVILPGPLELHLLFIIDIRGILFC